MLSLIKSLAALLGLAIGIGAIYAERFSHFVPSHLEIRIAFAAATACAIGGIALALAPPQVSPRRWLRPLSVRVPAFGLFSFGVGYLAFAAGFPAWYTLAFGHPGERSVTIENWRLPSRWSCAGPDVAEAPFLDPICLDYDDERVAPVGTNLVVRGRATALGINVETVSLR